VRKCALLALLVGLLSCIRAPAVRADGMSFRRAEGDRHLYHALLQEEQVALVAHNGSTEKLLIAIDIAVKDDEQALWIFPVPGSPEEVGIELADSFPEFSGANPWARAGNCLADLGFAARMTQIYPILLEGLLMGALGGRESGRRVGESVDRWGLRAEAVSVDSLDALAAYLRERQADVPPADLAVFEPYLGTDHTLVLAWIDSWEELRAEFPDSERMGYSGKRRRPCLYTEFPTTQPFYPMRPTAGYGQSAVGVTVCVAGYMRLDERSGAADWARLRHYRVETSDMSAAHDFSAHFPAGSWYTLVLADGPASAYAEDLWFVEDRPPWTLAYADGLIAFSGFWHGIPGGVVFIAVLSYLAGGLSGLILFRRWRGFARLGLWNLLTFLAIALVEGKVGGERGELLRAGRGKGFWKVSWGFVFSLVFIILTVLTQGLLNLPLASA